MNFNVLKRIGIVGPNSHGEAEEKSDKEYQKIIDDWKPVLWDKTRKNNTHKMLIYNGDKSSLLYATPPNNVYVTREKAKEIYRVKNKIK